MVTSHCSEDDLTLYYYGEARRRADITRHLQECASCTALYDEIAGTLALVVADEVPERGDQYGLEVWQRIRLELGDRSGFAGFAKFARFDRFARFARFTKSVGFDRLGIVAAAALLMIAAFVAGRTWRPPSVPSTAMNSANPADAGNSANPANPGNSANPANRANPDTDRILLTSVADHLDRSERVLTDIMNTHEPGDISSEQRWAEDLVTTSRLYRQDAIDAGEQSIATVLDDLERNLLEIVHSPSKISAADLEQIRRRIDAAALLFKVRVMSDELRQRETPPAGRALPRTSTPTIS
jgi:hypothetical protein